MATPRVFVSSTCYDLGEVRDSLTQFIRSYGFESSLSEHGDIFYHPDMHSQESCIKEIGNCHLLILIIGGRFGGSYVLDPDKSVVNAEYEASVALNLPVFTFIKQDVLDDHRVYQKNRDKAKSIVFPSIEKQEHAESIFQFINTVRHAPTNNGFFGFTYSKDIQEYLRRQWSGMFFDFLQSRRQQQQQEKTTSAIDNLRIVSSKIEELVKSVYRHLDEAEATEAIRTIDEEALAHSFFTRLSSFLGNCRKFGGPSSWPNNIKKALLKTTADTWTEYLVSTKFFYIQSSKGNYGPVDVLMLSGLKNGPCISVSGGMSDVDKAEYRKMQEAYLVFKALSSEKKIEIIEEIKEFEEC